MKEQDREMFDQQLQQLKNEYQETNDQLGSDNVMLSMFAVCLFTIVFVKNNMLLSAHLN